MTLKSDYAEKKQGNNQDHEPNALGLCDFWERDAWIQLQVPIKLALSGLVLRPCISSWFHFQAVLKLAESATDFTSPMIQGSSGTESAPTFS